tara:strand:- start:2981 stop:4393 length:1413 start_codon:yes stop_codon:yes gene_type:complete
MAITLEQNVAHKQMPVGTDWVFTISSNNVIGNYKFKYIADLHIDNAGSGFKIRLKFSPNATGNGIINISNILEQYVSPDNLGGFISGYEAQFKGVDSAPGLEMPIHCIDKLSLTTTNVQRLTIKWGEEYAGNSTSAPTEYINELTSSDYMFWNGVSYNNEQTHINGEYGISLINWSGNRYIMDSTTSKFLTDAPTNSQFIGDNEYATLSFLNGLFDTGHSKPDSYTIAFYNNLNQSLGIINTPISGANGGYNSATDTSLASSLFLSQYIGVGTANMLGAGVSIPSNWDYYKVFLTEGVADPATKVSDIYTYYKKGDDCKGFEKIRLTWLNKYGVWDYYNFTKKNTRTTDIKRTEINSIKGNWNGSTFSKYGYERGRGVLSAIATETMSLNSDWFSTDEEAAWLEQLFISPEVYILGGYDATDTAPAKYGNYMTPVIVTNNSYDKYTRANDKVAQYELDIEYSINKRIQRA